MQFTKATKRQAKLRLALVGPAGSGKTYTSLTIAKYLGERIAVIDSERGSASKYADEFAFDTLEPASFSPDTYIEAIQAAAVAGYDVCIIDSLSAAWTGKDGALEQVDMATKRSRSKNQFTDGWREVTPMHNRMIDAIVGCKMHVIATLRVKTEYIIEENDHGKKVPRKVGLAPIQRQGLEYEFDVIGDLDIDNNLVIDKTRCRALKGKVFTRPGEDMALILRAWVTDGAPALEEPEAQAAKPQPEARTPEQRKDTHHKLRMMLTASKSGADLDATKMLIGKARTDGFLSDEHMKDLIEYGTACRAKITKHDAAEHRSDPSNDDVDQMADMGVPDAG